MKDYSDYITCYECECEIKAYEAIYRDRRGNQICTDCSYLLLGDDDEE